MVRERLPLGSTEEISCVGNLSERSQSDDDRRVVCAGGRIVVVPVCRVIGFSYFIQCACLSSLGGRKRIWENALVNPTANTKETCLAGYRDGNPDRVIK